MAFRVEIAPRAFNDLDEIAEYIKQSEQAEEGFNGIIDAIRTLEDMPSPSPIADESEELGQEVRPCCAESAKYKVYDSIRQETPSTGTVRVLHVRHWARKSLSTDELRELMDESPDEGEADGIRDKNPDSRLGQLCQ